MITKGDLKFMRLAIEEARESRHKLKRIHPEVGAVAVRDGKLLASAHHGEKKPCDHAEYTLLEKKLPRETLADCTFYTTLEPCVKRNHPKAPCATRLVKRKVRRVVIGMLDPNQEITGKGILQLRKAGIAVDLFPRDLMAQLEELNWNFIDEQERLSDFYKPAPLQFWKNRKTWWAENIESVINESECLAVIDSYYGTNESFWHPLKRRMKDDKPFHLIIMLRKKGDSFLQDCSKIAGGVATRP